MSSTCEKNGMNGKAGRIEKILKRFEGLVDEETLNMLALYAMGELNLNCEVKNVRLYLSPDRAILHVKPVKPETGIDECRVLIRGEMLENLPKISAGSVISVSGSFAGDIFRAKRLHVLKHKSECVEGWVVAAEDRVLCVLSGNSCLSCYTAFASDNLSRECEHAFVSACGVKVDREVFVAKSVRVENAKPGNSFKNPFKPVEEAKTCSGRVCVEGRVSGIGQVKKLRGKEYASLHISDGSGRVRLMLWNDLSVYRKADIGSHVQVFGCRADGNALHCDEFTIIRLVQ